MNNPNADPDEAIDRLLTSLREVEPPDGMQQRIVRTAEERRSTPRHWIFQSPLATRHSWSVATATVFAIGLAALSIVARKPHPIEELAHAPTHSAPANASEATIYIALPPDAAPRPPRKPRSTPIKKHSPTLDVVNDDDALAISEMNAPSHPAPPMPLTEQEQFLLRMVHQGDPVELAMLDTRMRGTEFADSKAEFERFFAQPEPGKINQSTPNAESASGKSK